MPARHLHFGSSQIRKLSRQHARTRSHLGRRGGAPNAFSNPSCAFKPLKLSQTAWRASQVAGKPGTSTVCEVGRPRLHRFAHRQKRIPIDKQVVSVYCSHGSIVRSPAQLRESANDRTEEMCHTHFLHVSASLACAESSLLVTDHLRHVVLARKRASALSACFEACS